MADRSDAVVVTIEKYNEDVFDIGDVNWSARRDPPTGWLRADGSAVSRTTYADLFAAISPALGVFTVNLASPAVFSQTAHGLLVGDAVFFTTTGALPTGLGANTLYYVVSVPTADTFTVSATRGGSAINTSGSQSGVHTVWACPYGLGDGSTTFNVPDLRGRVAVGAAGAGGHADVQALGGHNGTALAHCRPKHRHASSTQGTGPLVGGSGLGTGSGAATPVAVGADTTNDPLDAPSYLVLNAFVKYV